MFEYENQLSLSKISLKTLQNLDIKKFPIKENFEKIFSFEKEEINIDKIIEQIKSIFLNERKINNIFLKNYIIINNENKLKFAPFIIRILNNIDSPLLIVSKNNLSIDRILLHISKNTKKLKIKKIIGHFNRKLRGLNYFNYHCVGYENKELEDKIKHNWHYLKKSLSENRVNSKTIKYCQTIYNSIIDDFYEISGIKRNDKNNIKNQIIECFLNEKNLKGFIQSQVRNNPEEYLTKFSIFSNTIGKDYKIKYLWERTEIDYNISTNEWKDNNIEYWYEQIGIEYNEEGEYDDDDFLFENENEEEEKNKIDYENNKLNNKIIENDKIIPNPLHKKKKIRKNYWLLDENERREFIKKIQEQINDYDFNYHNNLIETIEQFEKQEMEYSYEFLKDEDILGMTIYNGIKLKEIIQKMRINTIIINNPEEVSRSVLISLFHPSIKNIFYLFSDY